ncbi:MAG: undecaprenyl-diphosphatase [Patescibacteria group bacterium]|nr:undecaprenyl-diphosphatase [Patescibacteria group bacterium]
MNILQIIILSLVEGLTEFLPISSTGHMMVTASLLNITPSAFLSSFEIFIQLGAVLAVVVIYFNKLLGDFNLLLKVGAAFVPTAIIGFVFYPLVKNVLLESLATVAVSLFVGGVVLILFEWYLVKQKVVHNDNDTEVIKDVNFKESVIIGFCQSLAMIPGVSRAGATIAAGLGLGLSRQTIVEFSFFLAIPTILAAAGYDLFKTGADFSLNEFKILALGFIFSFIFAYITVKWLIKFVSTHNFVWFGVYRVVLACFIWFGLL